MPEKGQRNEEHQDDTQRSRREMVHLLRSILEEVTIQAQGRPRPLDPAAHGAIQLFAQIEESLTLTAGSPPPRY
jgi:hypothetical protein